MDPSQKLAWHGLPALIDQLIESAEPGRRDRILLEAVARRPWVAGCSLWRPGSDGPEFGARWHPVLSRGEAHALPERDAIHSVVQGERDGDFYPGVHVWHAGTGCGAFALAIAGGEVPAEEEDLLQSLLCLFAALDDGAEREPWISLLPSEESSRMEHELRNLMTGIQAAQELITSYGDELSDAELNQFSELLDEECTRAGDLLGHALSSRAPRAGELSRRPHALLASLMQELEARGGAPLRLAAHGTAREIECEIDSKRLESPLRAWLTELRRGCERVELALEATGDRAAPILLRASRVGGASRGPHGSTHAAGFTRQGLSLSQEGGDWCLRFPARRSA